MTTKEYLSQIKGMRKTISQKQEEINKLRSMLTSISVNTEDERVKASSDPDKIGSMIANILERESELESEIKEYVNTERVISAQIDGVGKWRCREILHWRYIENETFENISANRMDCTFRHAVRLHGQALKEFEKQYGNMYKICP